MVRLYIGGLAPDITAVDLQQRFVSFGAVQDCEVRMQSFIRLTALDTSGRGTRSCAVVQQGCCNPLGRGPETVLAN